MIVLIIAIALIYYSLRLIVLMYKGQTGPQVHEENKRLREENERLRKKS